MDRAADDALVAELADCPVAQAEDLGQHLVGMLAEHRRATRRLARDREKQSGEPGTR